jgi:hypothetical protein
MVVEFMAILNVAVTTCLMGTLVAPFAGRVETSKGAGLTVCSRPHPATQIAIRNAKIQIFRVAELRICFSYKPLKWRFPVAPPVLTQGW